jgi:hypothetical protein
MSRRFGSEIQAILFNKQNGWTPNTSHLWLELHKYKPIKKVHETKDNFRYRMKDPKKCNRLRIKHLKDGISFIFCF